VTRESLPTMDQTRKQSRIELANAPAALVGVEGGALEGLETTMQIAEAALAAEQVGGAQRVLNNAVEYAEEPRAVWATHRFVPGDQAQVRRHAARRRVGQVGRLLRRVGRSGAKRRVAHRRQPREVILLGGLLPLRPRRTSRSTGASASPGSITRTSTSSAPRVPSCS